MPVMITRFFNQLQQLPCSHTEPASFLSYPSSWWAIMSEEILNVSVVPLSFSGLPDISGCSMPIAKWWMNCPGFSSWSKFMLAWNWMILLQLHVLKYWSLGLRCSKDPFCQALPKWIQYLPADIVDRATHSQRHGQTVSCYRQTARHIESQKIWQSHT